MKSTSMSPPMISFLLVLACAVGAPAAVAAKGVRPAIPSSGEPGAPNIRVATDAQWRNYGGYVQHIVDDVHSRWTQFLGETKANPPSGGRVAVTFILKSNGDVEKISNIDSTSTKAGSDACVRSITENAHYGPWTENMKRALGSQQTITFTFSYQ